MNVTLRSGTSNKPVEIHLKRTSQMITTHRTEKMPMLIPLLPSFQPFVSTYRHRQEMDSSRFSNIFISYMCLPTASFPPTSSAMMTTERDDARRTKWFGGDASIDTTESAHDRDVAELPSSHAIPDSTLLQKRKPMASSVATKIILQDPWELYEARAKIFLERNVILARHRKRKLELVNVQQITTEPAVAQSLVETINRCSHHSFPRLHDFLQHENRYFLVWEPAEFTLNEVLASTCYITEAELAQIVWPV